MSGGLLILVWVWPLLLAALAVRPSFWWLPAIGALPGLAAALLVPLGSRLELPWLFLGTTLGLDATGRIYLIFTAILWLVSGIYTAFSARGTSHAGRFGVFFLLAMAGNLWLIVGQDLLSFYAGFAIMGLSAYGLVIHDGKTAALRAGKVYLVMALLGEVTLFAALVLVASHAGTTVPAPEQLVGLDNLTIALLILGLGVKAGMVPLHLWLPLAHPAAPIPASAVLSGTMIKVAILGWLRFLPLGAVALADWGAWLTGAGLLTMFYALPIGLMQSDPKVILAYSSIGKMGLLILLLGLILTEPALAPVGVAAITLYAAHHALAKGGLFLGVGLRKYAALPQPLLLAGLVFLALALAGAPLTSGAVTKYGIKPLLAGADWGWLSIAVAVSTVATTLLMARFLWVTTRIKPHPETGYTWPSAAWAVLVTLLLLFPFVLGEPAAWPTNAATVGAGIGIAVAVMAAARRYPGFVKPLVGRIPPGDLLGLIKRILLVLVWYGLAILRFVGALYARIEARLTHAFDRVFAQPTSDGEQGLRAWPVAGALWLAVGGLLFVAVLGGAPEVSPHEPAPRGEIAATSPLEADLRSEPGVVGVPGDEPPPSSLPDVDAETDRASAFEPSPRSEMSEVDAAIAAEAEEASTPAARTPARASDESSVEALAVCDPEIPFVFASPKDPAERISLQRCVRDPDSGAPRLLDAPPLTNRLVYLLQEQLGALGFDPGPVDGLIGPRTRDAVRTFQEARGIPQTGRISFDLLERLQRETLQDP
ncbi:proton-conducting transporter membrane subunit [Thiorhodococcus fuscus]|uniref:Proton-conducting transporter membrane subunit n=1 Tax=Thiorhodococcus fuscus TaxID=527200 RepID=A0ABW4Y7G8_9GAMM